MITFDTYDQIVEYVGDLTPRDLVSKMLADGYNHPYPLAELVGVDPDGGREEVATRIVNKVHRKMCEFCGVRPLEHVTRLDEVAVSLCDDCFAEMMSGEDYG